MIIDNKGKLFGKVSIIDILILLVLIGGGLGVFYKYSQAKVASPIFTNNQKYIMTIYGEEAPNFALQAAKVGDQVVERERSANMGKVIEPLKIDKGIYYTVNEQGQVLKSSREDYSSYFMKVEGSGVIVENGGVNIGAADYYVGYSVVIKVGKAIFSGRIYSIEKVKE